MADKRISQLIERTDIANNDVLPIVASGATTTNKVTISTIQDWMQDNLDVGVTSVGITLGTTGTDVNVTGSPITTSGNITINFPTASATNRGLLSSADWITFNSKQPAGNYVTLDTTQSITATKSFITGGGGNTLTVSQTSGSGIALNITKFGNGEGLKVEKFSGSGNAVTISGGLLSAEAATLTGALNGTSGTFTGAVISTAVSVTATTGIAGDFTNNSSTNETLRARNNGSGNIAAFRNLSGQVASITNSGGLTLSGALNGTSATFTAAGSTFVSATTTGGSDMRISSGATNGFVGTTSNHPLSFVVNNGVVGTIAVGGAATFSSSITASSIIRTGGTSSQFLKADGSVDSNTYLTTGTAASTYVPYTGATGGVDLGTHSLSSNNLIANGGLNAGALLLKNANAASTINTGYLTLSPSSTTTRVTFGFSTGASTWKSLSFSSHLLTDNTPTIFSFPNGGGTLAVTTDLSAYLPLTGGTLTGALNGTSASFTGASTLLTLSSGAGTKAVFATTRSFSVNRNFQIAVDEFAESAFTITPSTALGGSTYTTPIFTLAAAGAATFSSSVTATHGLFSSTVTAGTGTTSGYAVIGLIDPGTGSARYGSIRKNYDSPFDLRIRASNSESEAPIVFDLSNDTEAMRITSSGNVGIGTASPTSRLEVRGSSAQIQISQDATHQMYFGVDSSYGEIQAIRSGVGFDKPLILQRQGGNVGIGTASPAGQFEVYTDNYRRLYTSNIDAYTIRLVLGANSYFQQDAGNEELRIAQQYGSGKITFYTGSPNAERMRITSVGNTQPGADNAYSLGVSGTRWSAVWAANGTIQTSDEREKKDIVDSDLGLDLITKLRPVSFKWKVGQNVVSSQVVKDEEGNPILDEEGNEKTESVLIPREGKRTHYGLIAQEVEEVLDGKDFGGFIHDEETDTKGLRYDQFVPLLIKSIQELNEKIAILESKLK